MHFLNSVMLITCEMWPLLFLLMGALMWLLGWLFGRSKVSKLRGELDLMTKNNSSLQSENKNLGKDLKIVKSDYDKTNSKLISTQNNLDDSNNKLNSALAKTRMAETERSKMVSEKNSLLAEKDTLLSQKRGWDLERAKLKENSLEAADASISNKAIADLTEKLASTERALAECESSKIKDDNVSFVAPPPASFVTPPSSVTPPPSSVAPPPSSVTPPPSSVAPPSSFVATPPPTSGVSNINQLVSNTPNYGSTKGSDAGMGKYFKNENLQIMEGVGPKIESLLKGAGYDTWGDIANASESDLQKVLDDAGPRYRMHNPTAWSNQARFASKGQWSQLVQYQKDIDGGVAEPNSKAEKLYFKAMGFSAAKSDDLKVVEGIGPKIESLLKNAGVRNWSMLASTDVSRLQDILTSAGDRYRLADPATWPKQAELAASGKWAELKEYQDFLSGGKA